MSRAASKRLKNAESGFDRAERELLATIPRWRWKLRKRVRANAAAARSQIESLQTENEIRTRSKPRALRGISGARRKR